jgi:squalene-hopene/tetraprenyl-beta-curcumene cyclase
MSALPLIALLPLLAQGPALDADRLGEEIDVSLRFLRAEQDLDSGAYGAGAGTTARALLAFAASPRAYRASDGPFVDLALTYLLAHQAADGAFADPDASAALRTSQTLDACTALELLADERTRPVRARAMLFLKLDPGVALVDRGERMQGMNADQLLDVAGALLSTRAADGGWGEGTARLVETSGNVIELGVIARVLNAKQAPKAAKEATPLPAFAAADRARAEEALRRGALYLAGRAKEGRLGFEDGTLDPGITAMAIGALLTLREPRPPDVQRTIDAGLAWLVSLQQPDGSIHDGQLASYVTSAAVMALSAAKRAQDRPVIERARAWLAALQADEAEGYRPGDRYYGGVGYGGDERTDLSNLQMALEALAAAGATQDDAVFQRALVFLQRCQNRSESNELVVAVDGDTIVSGNDGGAGYAPGESKAGFVTLSDGRKVPRSYGSMSYALLKGYLFAGLAKDDTRVQAVWKWLQEHYTLDVNPGFEAAREPTAAYQGLFYYFHTLATALALYGTDTIQDAHGVAHDWRVELAGRLVGMQRPDGSWINANSARWYEGNPVLATSYALLALRAALP